MEAEAADTRQDGHLRQGRRPSWQRGAAQLSRRAVQRPVLLPGPGRMGAADPARWGPWVAPSPVSAETWTAARPSGGGRPGWTPAPGTACPSCRSWSPRPANGARMPSALIERGPGCLSGRGVHCGRADAHPLGPAACLARQHLGAATRPAAGTGSSTAKKSTRSGHGRPSKSFASPAAASRS